MGQLEANLKNNYERTLTKWQRVWRCNSGQAWSGKVVSTARGVLKMISFGRIELWPKGTPDLIGFDSIIITPDMVGRRVAVFVGTELKAGKNDRLGKKQREWRDNILLPFGAIHREVRHDGKIIESGFGAEIS